MLINFQFYLGNYVIWPFIIAYIFYVIGKPRFIVNGISKVLDFKLINQHQFYKISQF